VYYFIIMMTTVGRLNADDGNDESWPTRRQDRAEIARIASMQGDEGPLLARLDRLTVALAADVLDRLGFRAQVLSYGIRPLAGPERLVGRAFPIGAEADDTILDDPYEHELAAVDAVPGGAIVVLGTEGCLEAAVWGELLATRALSRGAAGAITDGAVRDLAALRRLGLPTYAAAVSANDSRGRVAVRAWGEPVVCGGVTVSSGDLVLGDADGVVVVPQDVAEEAVGAAEEKRGKEELVRGLLADGVSAAEVWERHRVL
jgi:4-hydroxy-4-methyl-2-oxoglutarate aldolase